jgi:hypothetical protein
LAVEVGVLGSFWGSGPFIQSVLPPLSELFREPSGLSLQLFFATLRDVSGVKSWSIINNSTYGKDKRKVWVIRCDIPGQLREIDSPGHYIKLTILMNLSDEFVISALYLAGGVFDKPLNDSLRAGEGLVPDGQGRQCRLLVLYRSR